MKPLEIANAFDHYFATIGKNMASKIPHKGGYENYVRQSHGRFELAIPDCVIIEKIMKNQQPKMSCGKDTINDRIVKTCCKELAEPMAIIIANSIREAHVPGAFKIARIIPLFKKGQANDCGNYRPVSLLSALSKILEKVICQQLMTHLEQNGSLCPNQFGFRPKCQTAYVVHKLCLLYTSPSPRDS